MDPKRRSQIVMLTLVGLPFGAVGLANNLTPHEMKRNLYADRAACERDYSPVQCEPSSTGGSSSSAHGYGGGYHGPYYSASRAAAVSLSDPGPGRSCLVTTTETSSRGGFG